MMPTEKPERILDHHFLILWDAHVAQGEIAERSGRFAPYKKFPNTMTTCPPGIMPATRGANEHEVIVGALNADFVEALEAEVDTPPQGSFQTLRGTDDRDLRNLLLLLLNESESAGRQGGLYVDSLTTALGMRLLFASRAQKQPADAKACPLPHRRLRRVLDRMRAGLGENIDLGILAAESGYSRAHFLRMFRAATGQSPHRYLLELRLAEAQALIANRSMPLIDIALACGFSSHAHLTTAFRSRYGVTPSTYRRDLELSEGA
jgi:AraC family transcriptional regulator